MARRSRVPPNRIRRAKARVEPKLALVVFCEGKRTEPMYLRAFASDHGNMLVNLELRFPGAPMTLVSDAIAHKKAYARRRKDSFEARDQVWCVFDRDEHPDVLQALQRARDSGIPVAYSNPCFELWPLLHFQDHDRPTDRHSMQRLLAHVMPKYDYRGSKQCDYDLMRSGYAEADKRAERMELRRVEERNQYGNPYTSIFRLTRLIVQNGRR
jgi:RloB-like protein